MVRKSRRSNRKGEIFEFTEKKGVVSSKFLGFGKPNRDDPTILVKRKRR